MPDLPGSSPEKDKAMLSKVQEKKTKRQNKRQSHAMQGKKQKKRGPKTARPCYPRFVD
jgi:hypothetical protein